MSVSKGKRFDIKITQKVFIMVIATILVIAMAIVFFMFTQNSLDDRIQLFLFFLILIVLVWIVYRTIKYISFKFTIQMK